MNEFIKKLTNNFSKKLKDINNLSSLIFFLSAGIYMYLSYSFFVMNVNNSDYFNQSLNTVSLISQNLEKNFKEKNLEIKFENKSFSTNIPEPITLENYNKEISTTKNLLYISKDAENKDFNEKDTFMILNSKDLKIMIGSEPVIYPIESIESVRKVINTEELSKFNQSFYRGSELFNSIGFNLIILFKSVELIFLLFIGNFILNYMVYGILYLSGYKNLNPNSYKPKCLVALGAYMIIKTPFSAYLFEPSFISILLILSVFVAVFEKSKLEKN